MFRVVFTLFLLLTFFFVRGQNLVLIDSIKIDIPDSYSFYQADIFNSLYFVSDKENSLLKYNTSTQTSYFYNNFTPSKKLFIINPLFMVVLDKLNKTLIFFDDKLIPTQDNVTILEDQIINPDLIYIEDNNSLTYFDEFSTESFIQYNYRNRKNVLFSISLPKEFIYNYKNEAIYTSKQSKFLLLKKIVSSDSLNEYKIIKLTNRKITSYDITDLNYYNWYEQNFYWISKDILYFYDFENEPKKIFIPKKGKNYYIFNRYFFQWNSKVMYLYKVETDK